MARTRCTKTGKRGRWNLNWYTSLTVCNLRIFFFFKSGIDRSLLFWMFPFLFPFQHWRLWQDYGERLSRCIHGTMEEEKKKERKKWNWLVSSAIKSVNRRESIFCIVGFLERIQWRAKFRASDRIDKMDRLKSTCMLFILLRPFFFMSILSFFGIFLFIWRKLCFVQIFELYDS